MEQMAKAQLLALLSKIDAASSGATAEASNKIRDAVEPGARATGGPGPQRRVRVLYNQPWQNFQGNLSQASVERQYFVDNSPSHDWKDGVENVRLVVNEAAADGRSLRSVGSAWSSSPVSQTPLYLAHCGGLSGLGPAIDPADLAPGVDPARISHMQAGTVIQTVNELLEQNNQSLHVMGGNGGQNIAGAAATGTHGSWIDRHALADTVHAVAMVGAGGKPYWIEPASRPLTRDGFTAWGVFEVVRDDALFSAAQASLGALGIVTSLVLDVDPLYFVHFKRVQRELDEPLRNAIYNLDLSGLGLAGRPAHFEVVLNPHQLGAGQKGAFMETGFVVPPGKAVQASVTPARQAEIAEHLDISGSLWDYVAKLLSDLPWLVPHVLDLVLPYVFKPEEQTGPLSQVWHVSTGGPPLISTELAVPQEKVEATLDLLRRMLDDAKQRDFYWPGVFGIRFGQGTGALLGFTRFDRWCTMELVYLRGVRGVEGFLRDFYAALRSAGIEHGVHLGQVNFLTPEQVQADYGAEALAKWNAARQRLGAGGQTFANDATNALGLTSPLPGST